MVGAVFFPKNEKNQHEQEKGERNPRKQPEQKDEADKADLKPETDTSQEERTVLLRQIADLEQEKINVQVGLVCQKELAAIMDSMQYLVGISRFLQEGGKLNEQQEANYFWYTIVKKCRETMKNKTSFDSKWESLKGAVKKQYSDRTNEELQNIVKQLKRETSDREIALSSRAVMDELNKKRIIENLALQEEGEAVDWDMIQKTGEIVKKIFVDNGMFFWFYDDKEVEKYHLQSEFNEGNSIAINIPAVFVKDTQADSVKLLGEYIGIYAD